MRYDKKYREKTIEYYEKGHTYKETANIFGISTNTLSLWLKQKKETGGLERKYHSYLYITVSIAIDYKLVVFS